MFKEIKIDKPGYFDDYNEETKKEQSPSAKYMEIMLDYYEEMEELIKNNYLHSEVKKQEFFNNNPEQRTLREQVETLSIMFKEMEKEKNKWESNANNDKDSNDQADVIRKVKMQEQDLAAKQSRLDTAEKLLKDKNTKINELQKQKKALDDKVSRFE